MKRSEAKSVAAILDEGFALAGLTDTMARQRACFLWNEVVGPGITRYTTRRTVDDRGVLHVYLSSAPLRDELGYHKSRLLAELNRRAGQEDALTDIRFH